MPAKAGIQKSLKALDSRLHGNDKTKQDNKKFVFEMGYSTIAGEFCLGLSFFWSEA
jgi:hypothetical protein